MVGDEGSAAPLKLNGEDTGDGHGARPFRNGKSK